MDLTALVEEARQLPAEIDALVAACGYGQATWGDRSEVIDTAPEYYRFLAGLVRATKARRVLECGTHWGGSARAMAAALPRGGRVLTLDIEPVTLVVPKVVARRCNGASWRADWLVRRHLRSVDLAFVDVEHEYAPTKACFDLAVRCGARLVVVDDIDVSEPMHRFWRELQDRYDTIDAGAIDAGIRGGPGFGLVVVA